MKTYNYKIKNTIVILALYWILLTFNTMIAMQFVMHQLIEWWISTFILMSIIGLCLLTYHKKLSILKLILYFPGAWLFHAILTIPTAQLLGLLMLDANHIRTRGEHRAIFILSSIPILIYFISKSRLFSVQKINPIIKDDRK